MAKNSLLSGFADWTATAIAGSGVLGSLVVFDVVQRLALPFGANAHQRVVSKMAHAINASFELAGARYVVDGLEHVGDGPYIIVMNHQSFLDISMTSDFLRKLAPRFVSKVELASGIPGVSYNLRKGGSVCIDRKSPDSARRTLAEFAERMKKENLSVTIFPEGTRSHTGEMKPFKETGLRTLVRGAPGIAILPISSSGGSKLFTNNIRPVVRNVKLSYRIHAPVMPPDPENGEAFSKFVRDLETTIRNGIA